MIKTGSDFSGVGAFDQALSRLGIVQDKMFACDMDKYARQTYILNYGEPKYYPENVYDREIPSDSLDIYMTSPPCQSFSLAGKRQGENIDKGVLFYNSHEFIQKNNPRYFIFENVKGLLSDDGGKTFQRWIDYLGGKTVNGNPVIFPHENSVPYHVYYQVMNAKHYGVPQNRERIFIIGIRDDADNEFSFPKPFHLVKRLKDVLETEVDEKYFLSDKMITWLNGHSEKSKENGNGFNFKPKDVEKEANSINARVFKMGVDDNYIQIPTNNSKGYDIAEEEEEDSINFSNPNSETRRGRVGHGVAQTLDTACNQGVLVKKINQWYEDENKEIETGDIIQTGQTNMRGERIYKTGISPTLPAENPRVVSVLNTQRIRRLTPAECFRLMDFNPEFIWDVSDSQAYKQAGNSICVGVLSLIISKLNLQ